MTSTLSSPTRSLTPSSTTTLRPPPPTLRSFALTATLCTNFRTPHHNTSTSNQVVSPVPPTWIHLLSGHVAPHGREWHIHIYNRPSKYLINFSTNSKPPTPLILLCLIFRPHRHCFAWRLLPPPRPVTELDLHHRKSRTPLLTIVHMCTNLRFLTRDLDV